MMSGRSTAWKAAMAASIATISVLLLAGYWENKRRKHLKQKMKDRKESSIDIGGIFGMDAGGTLTKIVYLETGIAAIGAKPCTTADGDGTADSVSSDAVSVIPCSPNSSLGPGQTTAGLPPGRRMKRESSENALSQLNDPDHQAALAQLYTHLNESYGSGGNRPVRRDDRLSVDSKFLKGKLHFMHFETKNMIASIQYLSSSALVDHVKSIGCTGGGAHKYEGDFERQLAITVNKFDELGCLIRGLHFALLNFKDECYTYRAQEQGAQAESSPRSSVTRSYEHKVVLPFNPSGNNEFPYLLVNIGSGVSIVKVSAAGKFERVSGTSLGGGTYWGLCRLLLTDCSSFDDVLGMAESGNAENVDMLVKDIYGSDYAGMLSGNMVASSFGKVVGKEKPREGVQEADLAVALLMMLTNNIGQVAHLNAQLHGCSKIYFLGNFLRSNTISCQRLAYAIDFWSKGEKEAIFLVHEGYFGAFGTFLMSAFGSEVDDVIASSAPGYSADAARKVKAGNRGVGPDDEEKNRRMRRNRSCSMDDMNTSKQRRRVYDGDNKFGKFISKSIESLRKFSTGNGATVSSGSGGGRARSATISSDLESQTSDNSSTAPLAGRAGSWGSCAQNPPLQRAGTPAAGNRNNSATTDASASTASAGIGRGRSPRGRTCSDDYVIRSPRQRQQDAGGVDSEE